MKAFGEDGSWIMIQQTSRRPTGRYRSVGLESPIVSLIGGTARQLVPAEDERRGPRSTACLETGKLSR